MNRTLFSVSLISTAAALLIISATAHAQPQDKAQQGCINALNKAGAKLAATQGKESSGCIKNATKGKEPDPQTCLTADGKGKVGKAAAKVDGADTKKCATAPDFGKAGTAIIKAFAAGEEVALAADVFGATLTGVIVDAGVDKVAAGCQAAVSKAY